MRKCFGQAAAAVKAEEVVLQVDKGLSSEGHVVAGLSRQQQGSYATDKKGPDHLIILVNGLFGAKENWNTIVQNMRQTLDSNQVLICPSEANRRTDTYDGIDVCGQRLAREIKGIVGANPSLTRLTVIGHSMGGLLVRYAVGVLFDPKTRRIAGLEPCHFISIATPHMGCDAEGISQVPFIGWLSGAPPLQYILSQASIPVASLLFKRTGRQFFLADEDMGFHTGCQGLPLLTRMTLDVPERGEYFWSALQSFASRTCYANTSRDHLVGWANSSLRFLHSLPSLPPEHRAAKGVVVEDPLLSAFDVRFQPQSEPQHATSRGDVPIDTSLPKPSPNGADRGTPPATPSITVGSSTVSAMQSTTSISSGARQGPCSAGAVPLFSSNTSSSSSVSQNGTGAAGREWPGPGHAPSFKDPVWRSKQVESMLQRLQQLSWRRIDVSFQGSILPFAHNHIQVTRRWLNWEGDSVAMHIAQLLRCTDLTYQELLQLGPRSHQPGPSPERRSVDTAAQGQGTSAAASLTNSLQEAFPGQVPQDEKERHERPL